MQFLVGQYLFQSLRRRWHIPMKELHRSPWVGKGGHSSGPGSSDVLASTGAAADSSSLQNDRSRGARTDTPRAVWVPYQETPM